MGSEFLDRLQALTKARNEEMDDEARMVADGLYKDFRRECEFRARDGRAS